MSKHPQLAVFDNFNDSSLPLQIHFWNNHPTYPLHSLKSFDKIIIATKGHGVITTNGQKYNLTKGQVYYVSGNWINSTVEADQLDIINILFIKEKLEIDRWDLKTIPGYSSLFYLQPNLPLEERYRKGLLLDNHQLNEIIRIVNLIESESTNKEPGYHQLAVSYFHELIVKLARYYHPDTHPQSEDILRIGKILSYMEANFQEDLSVEALAKQSFMSVRNFTRIFIKATRNSPGAHLIHLRILKSAEYLKSTHKSITDIAFEVGFRDSNYFSRQFKKHFGETPRSYRNKFH